ncbi:FAD:protein FMN transferase [Halomonas sp. BM-2019]|uniref:FAD:protein FMN transferase n=1 Tax=Halomonas sp. BM-2019 TaxID=2811227 RepID=UPI001B3C4A82|nr:MAG: FAD:protein FMN transferase [Halomonas sp. BM-2019]
MRPALFLLTLLMSLVLLAGCRQPGEWHQFEGVALGTGYHITLNGDLDEEQRLLLQAAIQGELASLDTEHAALARLLAAGRLPGRDWPAYAGVSGYLREVLHARAVDRLDRVLGEFAVAHGMIELGGVIRTRGMAGRHPWRVTLPHTGLADAPDLRLRLQDSALVSRSAAEPGGEAPAPTRLLAVSVVASSAEAAERLARELLAADPDAITEQPARLVVLTPQGIELVTGSSLEPLLER